MYQFRSVRCDMWRQDDWFAELEPDAKLVWIYTFTNDSTSPAGIYKIALRTISNDTGIALERVREIIEGFQRDGKLEYEDGVIWPITMRKHQVGILKDNDNLLKKIVKDVAELPQTAIVARYKAYYSMCEPPSDPLPTPFDGSVKDVPVNRRQDTGDKRLETRDKEPSSSTAAVRAAYDADKLMITRTHLDAHVALIERVGLVAWQTGWKAAKAEGKQNVVNYVTRCAESAMLAGGNGNGHAPPQEVKHFYVRQGDEDIFYRVENGQTIEDKRVPAGTA